MEVIIDSNSLRLSASGSITGVIYLQVDDIWFPDKKWNDFVVVILNWWVEALGSLKNNVGIKYPSRFQFMDGPYSYTLFTNSDKSAIVEFYEDRKCIKKFIIEIDEFAESLEKACQEILQKVDFMKWQNKDIETLKRSLSEKI